MKKQEMTYSFYLSDAEDKARNIEEMNEEERKEVFQQLAKQYIENGLHGEVITA